MGLLSGCACLSVHHIGTNHVSIIPVACWMNADGDRMVELHLEKKGMGSGNYDDLGSRYICANKARWEAEAESFREHFPSKEFIDIVPDKVGRTEDETLLFKDRFLIYPNLYDRSFQDEKPGDAASWMEVKTTGRPLSFVMQVGEEKEEIICLQHFSKMDSYERKDWWWYPTRTLYIPAVVVDVAMLPVAVPVVIYGILHLFDFEG